VHHQAVTVVTAAIAVTTVLSALGTAAGSTSSHPHGPRISMTTTTCAPRWRPPNPGVDHFAVANDSPDNATVYFTRPLRGRVVATLRHVKPHTVRELTVRVIAGGHYQWGCDLAGRPPRVSDAETALREPTHGGAGAPVVPVTRDELAPATKTYRARVATELGLLSSQVATLESDLRHGESALAQAHWLTAHLTWLRIGQDDGAYSAFGNHGPAIDGTAAGLVKGTADPRFRGFHKIEYDLWTRHDDASAATDAAALDKAVNALSAIPITTWFPLSTASVSNLTLRPHEVLEDALRDSLSGNDNYGSGTDLASVRADVTATRGLLNPLAPLITPRSAHLVHRARRALTTLATTLETEHVQGRWTALDALPARTRERIDAEVSGALEILSPVPDLLTVGNS
jgi:iron uptake system component EfeO